MELSLGAITYHYIDIKQDKHYEKCIDNTCQTIVNPLLQVGLENNYIFGGLNSIGKPMLGARKNWLVLPSRYITTGAYYQDKSEYTKRKLNNPMFMGDIVPVIGFDINFYNLGLLITPSVSCLYWIF